jgi:sialidase-1
VVDQSTGIIWLPFCWNNDRVFVTKSDDDGATWATPVEITADVKPQNWSWYATGPVHGVQLSSGRLLIPCDHRVIGEERNRSHVVYSDDHGATWRLGGVLDERTDECVAVETTDGSVYLNMRSYHGENRRAVARSTDGGESWSPVTLDEALIEPVCQASAIRFTDEKRNDRNRMLFSNPASTDREQMTVRVSYDEGRTWTDGAVLHAGPAAYSDLCVTSDLMPVCLYERGDDNAYETITFAVFSLQWLTAGRDSVSR